MYLTPKMQPSKAVAFWRGGARQRKKEYPYRCSDWSGLCDDEREVVRMGNGRGAKVLRFVVCAVITALVMLLTAPKAC